MTPEELRSRIPALEDTVYMNTGASGPSPQNVIEAGTSELERHEGPAHASGNPYTFAFDAFEATREVIASFIGSSPTEVALTDSTTAGINHVVGAIDWGPDDIVVRTDLEHAAGILPWNRLHQVHGVEVRVLETTRGRLAIDQYTEAVEDATLVCLSALTWTHGTWLPVSELVEIAHDAGALVLVDAVQVPGQAPMNVADWGADFVAAAGHKWLLGPWGAGYLYVDRAVADTVKPAAIGYRSVEDAYAEDPEYKPGAPRFEIGTISPVPYAGLREAIATIEEIGYSAIESRIRTLTDRLKAGVDDETLLSPRSFESGLVALRVDDPAATVDALGRRDVVVRPIPLIDAVRVSLHVFNTVEDVDRLLAGLARVS